MKVGNLNDEYSDSNSTKLGFDKSIRFTTAERSELDSCFIYRGDVSLIVGLTVAGFTGYMTNSDC